MQESYEVKLAQDIYALEQQADAAALHAKQLATRHAARLAELQSYLVNEGKTSTGHIEGIGVFQLKRANHVSVSQSNMPRFIEWLRKHDLGGLVQETVHPMTLKKTCKDKIEEFTELFVEDACAALESQKLHCPEIPANEIVPPAELAKKVLESVGVSVYQEIKISHQKKGK